MLRASEYQDLRPVSPEIGRQRRESRDGSGAGGTWEVGRGRDSSRGTRASPVPLPARSATTNAAHRTFIFRPAIGSSGGGRYCQSTASGYSSHPEPRQPVQAFKAMPSLHICTRLIQSQTFTTRPLHWLFNSLIVFYLLCQNSIPLPQGSNSTDPPGLPCKPSWAF